MSRSSTITEGQVRRSTQTGRMPPVHPGEILREEFLLPLSITPYRLARRLKVPRTRIERLIREETALTPDTALRLARYFKTSARFWLNMQAAHDLEMAERENGDAIAEIVPLHQQDEAA